jgi:polyether ionophore transport system permease protein
LLGIALIAGPTRRAEGSGRLETILGGRIARHQPTLAALVVASAAILVTSALFAAGLVLCGVPVSGSILYGAALGALAFVFAGFAALWAQLARHARGVYKASLVALAAAYVLRGVGDATTSWSSWLSPLGWAEKAAPFGDQRWWVLAVPAVAGLASGGAATWLAARRDVGSALLRGGAGPARASRPRRRPIGFAVWLHRPATAGWLAGGFLLTGMMGALARQFLGALARWLAAHGAVVVAGLVVIVAGSSLALALATAWSVGNPGEIGAVGRAVLDYLPAELLFAGLALAVFGLWPRGLAGLGRVRARDLRRPARSRPQARPWLLDLAPTTHVGNPPRATVHAGSLAALAVIAIALALAGFVAFRRRDIPRA